MTKEAKVFLGRLWKAAAGDIPEFNKEVKKLIDVDVVTYKEYMEFAEDKILMVEPAKKSGGSSTTKKKDPEKESPANMVTYDKYDIEQIQNQTSNNRPEHFEDRNNNRSEYTDDGYSHKPTFGNFDEDEEEQQDYDNVQPSHKPISHFKVYKNNDEWHHR